MLPSQSPAIFTVSRLNQTVRLLLEHEMGQVWISGEISNFTQPASGHWFDYPAASAIASVILAASLILLFSINTLQSRFGRRVVGH